MAPSTFADHLRALVTVAPGPSPVRRAAKAAITVLLVLAVSTAFGRPDLGMLCVAGTFGVLYAADAPLRRRLATVLTVGIAIVTSMSLGALTAASPLLFAATAVATAVVSAAVCAALRVGPPGAYFIVLTQGIAYHLVGDLGVSPAAVSGMAAIGAAVALVVTTAELLPDRHRPERRAVEHAAGVVTDYVASTPGPGGRPLHVAAAHALLDAAKALSQGARPVPTGVTARFDDAVDAYARRAAEGSANIVVGGPNPDDPATSDAYRWIDAPDAALDLGTDESAEHGGTVGHLRAARVPVSAWSRLRHGLRPGGEARAIATAVAVAALGAVLVTALATGLDQAHLYWSIAFAMLIVHQGGPRLARTYRAVHRLLGTIVGLGLFLLLALLDPSMWWLVFLVPAVQFVIELLVGRNYGLAVVFITPLALVVSTGGQLGDNPGALVVERLLDTVIGVGVAIVVVWTVARRAPQRGVRADTVRVLEAFGRVMTTPTPTDGAALELHRRLVDLQESATLQAAEEGDRAGPEVRTADALTHAGYHVLGAAEAGGVSAMRVPAEALTDLADAALPDGRRRVSAAHPVDERIRAAAGRLGWSEDGGGATDGG